MFQIKKWKNDNKNKKIKKQAIFIMIQNKKCHIQSFDTA